MRQSRSIPAVFAVAAFTLTGSVLAGPPARTLGQVEVANQAFQDADWKAAAAAFEQVLEVNPYNGEYWQNYGFAAHQLKQYAEAITAFEMSLELGYRRTTSMYNIACGHALQGHTLEALRWLELALADGFDEDDTLRNDSDLDSLRADPRFNRIVGIFPPDGLSRDEQWRYDLDFLDRRLRNVHYDLFGVMSRESYEEAMTDLKAGVPDLEDHEIAVGIQRILAMIGDGHTHILPPRGERFSIHRYPIDLYVYSDGLYVRAATPALADVVGGRVISIGGTPIKSAYDRVAEVCSVDNTWGLKASVTRHMVITEFAHALGIVESRQSPVPLVVEDLNGNRVEVVMTPIPYRPLADAVSMGDDAEVPAPLWKKRADDRYWFEYLNDQRLVYFQYNSVRDDPNEPIVDFSKRLFEFIESNPVEYLVIDMRRNSGGNNFLNEPIVHGLIRCEKINRPGHLFVIAGRHTFSAAMNGATDIERNTAAMFVGEPTGSKPNFVGETNLITLPCTGVRLTCSSLYLQRSHAFDDRTWIAPDLVAEMSSEDYRTNRDPAMETILGYVSR